MEQMKNQLEKVHAPTVAQVASPEKYKPSDSERIDSVDVRDPLFSLRVTERET